MAKPKPLFQPKAVRPEQRVTIIQRWTSESARFYLEGMLEHEAELKERKALKKENEGQQADS